MQQKYKEFKDVEVGDIATDYCDQDYKVLFKGTLKECFEKFGDRCAIGLEDCLDGDSALETSDAVVLYTGEQWDSNCAVYFYSHYGAEVKIK